MGTFDTSRTMSAGEGRAGVLAEGAKVAGWRVLRPIGPKSLLVVAEDLEASRQGESRYWHVMRQIPTDCLAGGGNALRLHEQVRLRLEKLRDLPEVSFVGPGRVLSDGGRVYCLRRWVSGKSLAECKLEASKLLEVSRQVLTVIDRMHLLGMVHGGIKLGNVLITGTDGGEQAGEEPSGPVVLTDASYYWQDRVGADVDAAVRTLRQANGRLRPPDSRLAMALGPGAETESLAELRRRLSAELSADDASGTEMLRRRASADLRRSRRRYLALAALVAAMGCGIAAGTWWLATGSDGGWGGVR